MGKIYKTAKEWVNAELANIIYEEDFPKMERLNASYLRDFNFIMLESYGKEIGEKKIKELNSLLKIQKDANFNLTYEKLLSKVDEEKYFPQTFYDNITLTDNSNISKPFVRKETGDILSVLVKNWTALKILKSDDKCMYIGENKKTLNLLKTDFGFKHVDFINMQAKKGNTNNSEKLDNLLSKDNSYDMIYQRDAFSRSSDVRTTINECIRVLNDGGIFIYDDVQEFTYGLNETLKTNISSNEWIINYFKINENVKEILYMKQVPSQNKFCKKIGQIVIRIAK